MLAGNTYDVTNAMHFTVGFCRCRLNPIKAVHSLLFVACNCVRICTPSDIVCVDFDCANINIIMRHSSG